MCIKFWWAIIDDAISYAVSIRIDRFSQEMFKNQIK